MDSDKTRPAADQHSRACHVLSDVSPEARGQNAYPCLPHTQLCDGRQLSVNEKFMCGDWN